MRAFCPIKNAHCEELVNNAQTNGIAVRLTKYGLYHATYTYLVGDFCGVVVKRRIYFGGNIIYLLEKSRAIIGVSPRRAMRASGST